MRSEQQMYDLILSVAQNDGRIRAVILNGSRANPAAPPDFFQDFDIVYIVTDMQSFRADPHWIDVFGERMILQLPDDMSDPPPEEDHAGYAYLMQFMDGNRIDLTLYPLEHLSDMEEDSLTLTLLDKDGILPAYPPPDERDYLPKPPTLKAYADCCNEFWWCAPYAAKGLWRKQILYAKAMIEETLRVELMKMLRWYIGMQTGFRINPGKMGKYFERYLDSGTWQMLLATYADAGYESTWDALERLAELFRGVAQQVGAHFGYPYPAEDDARVSAHLRHVRALPADAKEMY